MTAVWVWLFGTAAYLVLAGQISLDEVVAGLVLGGLGVIWRSAVRRCSRHDFTFERRAGSAVLQALGGLPGAILRVGTRLGAAILHGVDGRIIEQPFHRGRLDDPRDEGRRAAVVLTTSLAPDSYVLRLPIDEETMVVHAITHRTPGPDPRWPV